MMHSLPMCSRRGWAVTTARQGAPRVSRAGGCSWRRPRGPGTEEASTPDARADSGASGNEFVAGISRCSSTAPSVDGAARKRSDGAAEACEDCDVESSVNDSMSDRKWAFAMYVEMGGVSKQGAKGLRHTRDFKCHQQPPGNTCGFYVCHHMDLLLDSSRITNSKAAYIPSTALEQPDISRIRGELAYFLVAQVIKSEGQFHCAP